jgi:hypothetical protein
VFVVLQSLHHLDCNTLRLCSAYSPALIFAVMYAMESIPVTIFVWNKCLRWAGLGGRRWALNIRIGESLFGERTESLLDSPEAGISGVGLNSQEEEEKGRFHFEKAAHRRCLIVSQWSSSPTVTDAHIPIFCTFILYFTFRRQSLESDFVDATLAVVVGVLAISAVGNVVGGAGIDP